VRAVFLGTPGAAVPFLDALLNTGHEVPLVVTQPDRPVGRSGVPRPPAVKVRAEECCLDVIQPRSVRKPHFLESLRSVNPDLLVVVAYGRILPVPVIEDFPHGAVNVHFSLLPRFRGAAPVQWCLARGEKVTGVTAMRMSKGMDEGDILLQSELRIEPGEHSPALHRRLSALGVELLIETLIRMEGGDLVPRPQDHEKADYAPLLARRDGEPQVDITATEIEGRIRGFDPWPGVWYGRRGKRIRLIEARAVCGGARDCPPGRIIGLEEDALVMACGGETRLAIDAVQPEGRRPIGARDAVNGRHLLPGDDLEPLQSRG